MVGKGKKGGGGAEEGSKEAADDDGEDDKSIDFDEEAEASAEESEDKPLKRSGSGGSSRSGSEMKIRKTNSLGSDDGIGEMKRNKTPDSPIGGLLSAKKTSISKRPDQKVKFTNQTPITPIDDDGESIKLKRSPKKGTETDGSIEGIDREGTALDDIEQL